MTKVVEKLKKTVGTHDFELKCKGKVLDPAGKISDYNLTADSIIFASISNTKVKAEEIASPQAKKETPIVWKVEESIVTFKYGKIEHKDTHKVVNIVKF